MGGRLLLTVTSVPIAGINTSGKDSLNLVLILTRHQLIGHNLCWSGQQIGFNSMSQGWLITDSHVPLLPLRSWNRTLCSNTFCSHYQRHNVNMTVSTTRLGTTWFSKADPDRF